MTYQENLKQLLLEAFPPEMRSVTKPAGRFSIAQEITRVDVNVHKRDRLLAAINALNAETIGDDWQPVPGGNLPDWHAGKNAARRNIRHRFGLEQKDGEA